MTAPVPAVADASAVACPVSGAAVACDVSVVVVSFNTAGLLAACLQALTRSEGVALEVFVVDNASHDGSAEMVARDFPAVRLIRNPSNRGFAAANNIALREARGRHVLLLNPDTLVQPATVATLAAFLDARPDVGITGPRVLNADGTLQSCGYWYPTLVQEIRASRQANRLLGPWLGPTTPRPDDGQSSRVDWVDGCCLLARREVLEQIGPLDEQFFLYAEELDWCRSARKAGWDIVTCPSAEMTHLQGQSSAQVSERALALLVETRLRFYRKHDGLAAALLVSVVYALGCLRQWREAPLKNRAKLRGIREWWRSLTGRRAYGPPGVGQSAASAER